MQYCFTLQVSNNDVFILCVLFGDFLVENMIMRHFKCIFNIKVNANIAIVIVLTGKPGSSKVTLILVVLHQHLEIPM